MSDEKAIIAGTKGLFYEKNYMVSGWGFHTGLNGKTYAQDHPLTYTPAGNIYRCPGQKPGPGSLP